MANWLLLPPLQKLADIAIFTGLLSFLFFAIGAFIKWTKPLSGEFGKNGLIFKFSKKNEEPPNTEKELTSLIACKDTIPSFDASILLVVTRSIALGQAINHIDEVSLIRKEMNLAQTKVDLINGLFLRDYQELINELGSKGVVIPDSSYKVFQEFMHRLTRVNMMAEFKRIFNENGIADMSEDTFEDIYCRDHIKSLIESFRMGIHTFLPSNINPPIREVILILDHNETKIYNYLKEALQGARSYTEKAEEEKRELREAFDIEIQNATGIKNASGSAI